MHQQIHILILPSWYPNSSTSIGGSFFREQAIALVKQGNKVGVIAPLTRSLKDLSGVFWKPYGLRVEIDEKVKTFRWHSVNLTPRLYKINRKRWVRIGEKLFQQYIEENGTPDIIHVHSMINSGFLALKLSEKYNIPYVITEHSTAYSRKLISNETIKELYKVVRGSRANLAVSREFTSVLNTIFDTNTWKYLPNIVNDDFFKNNLSSNNTEKSFEFLTICFLEQKKRVDILIKAFSKAFSGNLKFKLKIGGDGPLKAELEELVRNEGIEKQVTFLGMLSRNEVKNEIQKTDVFVLSSEYETFGVVVIEALALGKPVIATKCGGPESIVTSKVGILVEINSVKAMVLAMEQLFNNYANYNSQEIRDYCYQHFSEKSICEKIQNKYEMVLNNK